MGTTLACQYFPYLTYTCDFSWPSEDPDKKAPSETVQNKARFFVWICDIQEIGQPPIQSSLWSGQIIGGASFINPIPTHRSISIISVFSTPHLWRLPPKLLLGCLPPKLLQFRRLWPKPTAQRLTSLWSCGSRRFGGRGLMNFPLENLTYECPKIVFQTYGSRSDFWWFIHTKLRKFGLQF